MAVKTVRKRPTTRPTPKKRAAVAGAPNVGFDLPAFLDSAGVPRGTVRTGAAAVIFSQGDAASDVLYIQQGRIKLSVLSKAGKEAVIAVLGAGDCFGEGCLAGQPRRMATATALTATTVVVVAKSQMVTLLHREAALADRFLAHMLARNIRIEEDLVDQLFNSSEKRLARTLLLLARYGRDDNTQHELPKLSQETLAEMIGTTRSRVNFFMNKFRELGFIEYNGGLKVNSSLMSVVLHE